MAKTFKNAKRVDAQCCDPLDVCLVGGKALPKDEQGPLDTDWDPSHTLHAHDLLKPLDPLDIESVFQHGVIVPIEVVRINDVPTVDVGRGRVRKARLANIRRKEQGLPLIEIKFTVTRITNGVQLLSRMIAENIRRKNVGVLDRIDLAKQLMGRGASEEQAAAEIGLPLSRFKSWLGLEDKATPEVLAALQQDRLNPSSALELSVIDDPALQNEALARFLMAPNPTARVAKSIVRAVRGKPEVVRPRLPEQKRLLVTVDKLSRGNEWMQGAKAALRWVCGEGTHKDLGKLLEEAEGGEGGEGGED